MNPRFNMNLSSNTMTAKKYVTENIIWGILAVIIFRNIGLFRCVTGEYRTSNYLLWALLIVCISLGIIQTINNRNDANALINIVFPLEIYALLSYIGVKTHFVRGIILGGIALLVLIITFMLNPKQDKHTRKSILGIRLYVVFMFSGILISVLFNTLFEGAVFIADRNRFDTNQIADSKNAEISDYICGSTWETLDLETRIDVLQVYVDIESERMGLPYKPIVSVKSLEGNTLGNYNYTTRVISIDLDYVSEAAAIDSLRCIFHEVFHAYQHALCEAYGSIDPKYSGLVLFNRIQAYQNEFAGSILSLKEDYDTYYNKAIEQDARKYADQAVAAYIEW